VEAWGAREFTHVHFRPLLRAGVCPFEVFQLNAHAHFALPLFSSLVACSPDPSLASPTPSLLSSLLLAGRLVPRGHVVERVARRNPDRAGH